MIRWNRKRSLFPFKCPNQEKHTTLTEYVFILLHHWFISNISTGWPFVIRSRVWEFIGDLNTADFFLHYAATAEKDIVVRFLQWETRFQLLESNAVEPEKSSVHQFIVSLQLLQIMFQDLQHGWTTSWLWIDRDRSSPTQTKDDQVGKRKSRLHWPARKVATQTWKLVLRISSKRRKRVENQMYRYTIPHDVQTMQEKVFCCELYLCLNER